MTRDDDRERDDDPMMQSMRSVWLSMRDEEPSSKGLDALLSAARSKAVEMKPAPRWWQTVFTTLRRPPVLAFATVVILVSGALLIGKSDVTPVVDRRSPVAEPPRPATDVSGQSRVVQREQLSQAKDPPPADPVKTEPPERPTTPPTVVEPPRVQTNTAPPPRVPSSGAGLGSAAPRPPVVQPPVAEPEAHGQEDRQTEAEEKQKVLEHGGLVTADTATVKADTGDKKKSVADETRSGRLEIANDDEVATSKVPSGSFGMDPTATGKVLKAPGGKPAARGPSSEQLLQQAESAATRGDCTAVKVTVERIKKTDAEAYRSRVAKSTSLARCLSK